MLEQRSACYTARLMISLKRMVAAGAVLLMAFALVSVSVMPHEHATDGAGGDHADCDACHFLRFGGVEIGGSSASSAPDLVVCAAPPPRSDGRRSVVCGARSARGPPTPA